jgi:hypothetical protein
MNAPKKIWVEPDEAEDRSEPLGAPLAYGEIPYIRADLVLGLVEALNECLKVGGYKNARDMIEAALAKLEEE